MSDDVERDEDGHEIRKSPREKIAYRVLTIVQAEEFGTELELLFALRRESAKILEKGPSPRDFAAISRRMIEYSREIEAAETAEMEEGGVDNDEPDEELSETDL